MKKFRVLLSILLVFVLLVTAIGVFAESSVDEYLYNNKLEYYEKYHDSLKNRPFDEKVRFLQDLQIIQGTENGLELDKSLTRVEGATIYSRLLALYYEISGFEVDGEVYDHGFKDVPEWANSTISVLKRKGLVNGISSDMFGSENKMSAKQFGALLLRALGYSDKNGDFEYDKTLDKLVEVGVLDEVEKNNLEEKEEFTRGDMCNMAYNALICRVKDEGYFLMNKSIDGKDGNYSTFIGTLLSDDEMDLVKSYIGKLDENEDEYYIDVSEVDSNIVEKFDKLINQDWDISVVVHNGEVIEVEKSDILGIRVVEDGDYIVVRCFYEANVVGDKTKVLISPGVYIKNNLAYTHVLCSGDEKCFTYILSKESRSKYIEDYGASYGGSSDDGIYYNRANIYGSDLDGGITIKYKYYPIWGKVEITEIK